MIRQQKQSRSDTSASNGRIGEPKQDRRAGLGRETIPLFRWRGTSRTERPHYHELRSVTLTEIAILITTRRPASQLFLSFLACSFATSRCSDVQVLIEKTLIEWPRRRPDWADRVTHLPAVRSRCISVHRRDGQSPPLICFTREIMENGDIVQLWSVTQTFPARPYPQTR